MKVMLAFMLMLMLGSAVSGQQKKAVIVFPAEFNGIVNAYVNFRYVPLEVRTKADPNTLTVRYIMADRPTHLYFSRMLGNTNELKFQSLLTLPNDSIVLNRDGINVSYAKGYSAFIDNLISIEQIYPQQKLSILRTQNDIRELVQKTENNYRENELKIKDLKLDKERCNALSSLNFIVKCATLTHDSFRDVISRKDPEMDKILDSVYKEIIANHTELERVNSPFVNRIYSTLVDFPFAATRNRVS